MFAWLAGDDPRSAGSELEAFVWLPLAWTLALNLVGPWGTDDLDWGRPAQGHAH